MKKLLLVRHAKATHESGYADFERPLKPSGLKDAAIMAGRLNEHSFVPQLLVSSPALRTISTANVLSQHMAIPLATEEVAAIYEASRNQLVDVVNRLSDDYDFIGLVGHNPGIGDLLNYLTDKLYDVPPGAVAVIEFDIDSWLEIGAKCGAVIYYDTPKS